MAESKISLQLRASQLARNAWQTAVHAARSALERATELRMRRDTALAELASEGREVLARELAGEDGGNLSLELWLELRYEGTDSALAVRGAAGVFGWRAAFEREHRARTRLRLLPAALFLVFRRQGEGLAFRIELKRFFESHIRFFTLAQHGKRFAQAEKSPLKLRVQPGRFLQYPGGLFGLARFHQQMAKVFMRFGEAGRKLYCLSEVFLSFGDLLAFQQDRPEQRHHVDIILIEPDGGTTNGFGLVEMAGINQRDGLAESAF